MLTLVREDSPEGSGMEAEKQGRTLQCGGRLEVIVPQELHVCCLKWNEDRGR